VPGARLYYLRGPPSESQVAERLPISPDPAGAGLTPFSFGFDCFPGRAAPRRASRAPRLSPLPVKKV